MRLPIVLFLSLLLSHCISAHSASATSRISTSTICPSQNLFTTTRYIIGVRAFASCGSVRNPSVTLNITNGSTYVAFVEVEKYNFSDATITPTSVNLYFSQETTLDPNGVLYGFVTIETNQSGSFTMSVRGSGQDAMTGQPIQSDLTSLTFVITNEPQSLLELQQLADYRWNITSTFIENVNNLYYASNPDQNSEILQVNNLVKAISAGEELLTATAYGWPGIGFYLFTALSQKTIPYDLSPLGYICRWYSIFVNQEYIRTMYYLKDRYSTGIPGFYEILNALLIAQGKEKEGWRSNNIQLLQEGLEEGETQLGTLREYLIDNSPGWCGAALGCARSQYSDQQTEDRALIFSFFTLLNAYVNAELNLLPILQHYASDDDHDGIINLFDPQKSLSITAHLDKSIYPPSSPGLLELDLSGPDMEPVIGANITYSIKNSNGVSIPPSYTCQDLGNGQYRGNFTTPSSVADYSVDVVADASNQDYEGTSLSLSFVVEGVPGQLLADPSSFILSLSPSSEYVGSTELWNKGLTDILVSVSKYGEISDWISYTENSFNIGASVQRNFFFTISVPASAGIGITYEGGLKFTYQGIELNVPIKVTVIQFTDQLATSGSVNGQFSESIVRFADNTDHVICDSTGRSSWGSSFTLSTNEFDRLSYLDGHFRTYKQYEAPGYNYELAFKFNGQQYNQNDNGFYFRSDDDTLNEFFNLTNYAQNGQNNFWFYIPTFTNNANRIRFVIDYVQFCFDVTTTAWSADFSVPQSTFDQWMAGWDYAMVEAHVNSVPKDGWVRLFVNGKFVDDEHITSSDVGRKVYFWFEDTDRSFLSTSNHFNLKGCASLQGLGGWDCQGDNYAVVDFGNIYFKVIYYSGSPILQVSKTVSPSEIMLGQTATVTITIHNVGTNVADKSKFNDNLPSGLSLVAGHLSASPEVDPGEVLQFQYTLRGDAEGSYTLPALRVIYEDPLGTKDTAWSDPASLMVVRPQNLLVTVQTDTTTYYMGSSVDLSVEVKDENTNPVLGALVTYNVHQDSIISEGICTDPDNEGTYSAIFNAPTLPDTYTVVTTASKQGCTDKTTSISLIVKENPPLLVANPIGLVFSSIEDGSNPDSQTILIMNGGGGVLNWNITEDVSWLSATPSSGQDSSLVTVDVDITGLTAEDSPYEAMLIVTASGAYGSPKHIPVILVIETEELSDFAFDPLPSPPADTIYRGDSTFFLVFVKSLNGFDSTVTLSVDTIIPQPTPGTLNCIFSDESLVPTDTTILKVSTTTDLWPQEYNIWFKAEGGGRSHNTFVTLTVVTSGNIIYVDSANTSGVEDGTSAHPFNTIQEAVDIASDHWTILVARGTYLEYVVVLEKDLALVGAGADITIIKSPTGFHVVQFYNVGAEAKIEGFTITFQDTGYTTYSGIMCYNSSPIISRNVVFNVGMGIGGDAGSEPTIINNTIYGCYYYSAICFAYLNMETVSPIIKNNIICNASQYYGNGVVWLQPPVTPVISYNNTYKFDGGWAAYFYCCPWTVTDGGVGAISADPLFVNLATGNFRLQSGSPCINAGDPNPIYNDPDGTRNDMGAFYYDATWIEDEQEEEKSISGFFLFQNYPNPFNPETIIEYQIPRDGWVILDIYNILGQRIRQLFAGEIQKGYHRISWDGKDDNGTDVANGIYFYRIKAGEFSDVKKMILLK